MTSSASDATIRRAIDELLDGIDLDRADAADFEALATAIEQLGAGLADRLHVLAVREAVRWLRYAAGIARKLDQEAA